MTNAEGERASFFIFFPRVEKKGGQEQKERWRFRREKKEKKQGARREQPTCYHTVFNNSVAATRGLHVHATAVQCLLGVCAAHTKGRRSKSQKAFCSVCRLQAARWHRQPRTSASRREVWLPGRLVTKETGKKKPHRKTHNNNLCSKVSVFALTKLRPKIVLSVDFRNGFFPKKKKKNN